MRCIFLAVCLLSLMSIQSMAQKQISDNLPDSLANKRFCFNYDFRIGDTLVYHAYSRDSMVYDEFPTLSKERNETWRYIILKKLPNNHTLISIEMIGYAAQESQGSIRNQMRMNSVWTGRKVFVEIDSTGKRYDIAAIDSITPAVSPGGAFQPILFTHIGKACVKGKNTWDVGGEENLIENGIPVPLVNYASLARFTGYIDTLGVKCHGIQFTTTGQGIAEISFGEGKDKTATVSSVINQFTKMELSEVYRIPVHSMATSEIKFTLTYPNGKKTKGVQHILTHYTLRNYRFEK